MIETPLSPLTKIEVEFSTERTYPLKARWSIPVNFDKFQSIALVKKTDEDKPKYHIERKTDEDKPKPCITLKTQPLITPKTRCPQGTKKRHVVMVTSGSKDKNGEVRLKLSEEPNRSVFSVIL